jgi:phosphoribosylglycinamide formyltransferase-1
MSRVILIAWDGADWRILDPLLEQGALPNLQALIDAQLTGTLGGRIGVVISNKANAAGLDRARAAGIDTLVLDHRSFPSRDDYDRELARILREEVIRPETQ